MDDVVRECVCDGLLDNRGGSDGVVKTIVPYQYTGTKKFVTNPAVLGEATHPVYVNWVGSNIRPRNTRLHYLAVVEEGNNI